MTKRELAEKVIDRIESLLGKRPDWREEASPSRKS